MQQTPTFVNQFTSQSGSSERTALSVKLIGSRNTELLPTRHLTSFGRGSGGVVNGMWTSFMAARNGCAVAWMARSPRSFGLLATIPESEQSDAPDDRCNQQILPGWLQIRYPLPIL